jgi:hypothetical protein
MTVFVDARPVLTQQTSSPICRSLSLILAMGTFACQDDSTATDTSTETSSGTVGDGDGDGDGDGADEEGTLYSSFSQVKQFDFNWTPKTGADRYQLLERVSPDEPYLQLGDDILGESASFTMPLHLRGNASYALMACTGPECAESDVLDVTSLEGAIGYVKAAIPGAGDFFATSIALSGDGNTLAVGARWGNEAAIDGGSVYTCFHAPIRASGRSAPT